MRSEIGTTKSLRSLIKRRFVGKVGGGGSGSTGLFRKSCHTLLKERRNGSGMGSVFVVEASERGAI